VENRIEFDRRLHLKTTKAQFSAVATAARKQSTESGHRIIVSDYVRGAVMAALKRDGVSVAA